MGEPGLLVAERTGGANAPRQWDVVVVGGGCAGLTAALAARHRGCSVLVLDAGTFDRPGGNTRHARSVRLVGVPGAPARHGDLARFSAELEALDTPAERQDLVEVTAIGATALGAFMVAHGVRFGPPYVGALQTSEFEQFIVGGGLALIRAYRRACDRMGVVVASDAGVVDLDGTGPAISGVVADVAGRREVIAAAAVVVASGGGEAGVDDPGWPTAVLRGGLENTGALFAALGARGALFAGGGVDAVVVDDRSPAVDGGVIGDLEALRSGLLVDLDGRLLAHGPAACSGEVVATAPDGRAVAIWGTHPGPAAIPSGWPSEPCATTGELAVRFGLDPSLVDSAITDAERGGTNLGSLPYFGAVVRPGITQARRGLVVGLGGHVCGGNGSAFPNVFAAGEAMAGSIRPTGDLAGLGLTIAGVWGRIAAEGVRYGR